MFKLDSSKIPLDIVHNYTPGRGKIAHNVNN